MGKYLFGLITALTLSACGLITPFTGTGPFDSTPSEPIEWKETITRLVENCDSDTIVDSAYTYTLPYSGGSFSAENLNPNGGEPFVSLHQQVVSLYGHSLDYIRLWVPPGVIREFEIEIDRAIYGGIVHEQISGDAKFFPNAPVTYSYHIIRYATITNQRDFPCN